MAFLSIFGAIFAYFTLYFCITGVYFRHRPAEGFGSSTRKYLFVWLDSGFVGKI